MVAALSFNFDEVLRFEETFDDWWYRLRLITCGAEHYSESTGGVLYYVPECAKPTSFLPPRLSFPTVLEVLNRGLRIGCPIDTRGLR